MAASADDGCILVRQGPTRSRPYFPCQDLRCGGRSDPRRRLLAQNFHLCRHYRRHRPYFDDNFRKLRLFWKPAFCPNLRTMVLRDAFEDVNRQSIAYFSREMTGNVSNKVHLLANNTLMHLAASHEVFTFSAASASALSC